MKIKKQSPALFYDASVSVKGHHKPLNEDAFKAIPDKGLWVIADGMGGYDGGKIASKLAVNYITNVVLEGENLVTGIELAHQEICALAKTAYGKIGMATTVVVAKIEDAMFEIAWVGDSRAYLFDNGQLKQLSHDHSLVQALIDSGDINKEQARIHPQRNFVTQALGGKAELKIDTIKGSLGAGILLLCTDGLSSELNDNSIVSILAKSKSLTWKANELISAVLKLKASDNITVLLIQAKNGLAT
ncbi:MAG: serine/threonine-protein phosphatase [Methylococcales bacterium]|nr:serine/threonine-protein phosphatase [Methylococcales bacterium]